MSQTTRTLQETVTTLAPAETLEAAKQFFARQNGVYAAFPEQESARHLTLRRQGGEDIIIGVTPAPGGTRSPDPPISSINSSHGFSRHCPRSPSPRKSEARVEHSFRHESSDAGPGAYPRLAIDQRDEAAGAGARGVGHNSNRRRSFGVSAEPQGACPGRALPREHSRNGIRGKAQWVRGPR